MKSRWVATLVTVAVASILTAMLATMCWALLREANTPSGRGYSYQGTNKSFAADLAAGRVSAVEVNLSEEYLDVTSDMSTYRVSYPAAREVFARLADHPKVSVSTAASPTPLAVVFLAALATAAAGSLLTWAALRHRPQGEAVLTQPAGEGGAARGDWAQAARVAILVVVGLVVLSVGMSVLVVGMSVLVELAIR